jgi:hypothetical protein
MCYRSNERRTSAEQRYATDALRAPLMPTVTLLEDHRQKRLFLTTRTGARGQVLGVREEGE